jgi:hypothetical protein
MHVAKYGAYQKIEQKYYYPDFTAFKLMDGYHVYYLSTA